MKTEKVKVEKKKPAYGDYTPSAQKQAHIDAEVRKAAGKGFAVDECMLGVRNSWSKTGGQPFQRYIAVGPADALKTIFVAGFTTGEITVTVNDTPDRKSYTIKKYLKKQADAEARLAKKAAKKSEAVSK